MRVGADQTIKEISYDPRDAAVEFDPDSHEIAHVTKRVRTEVAIPLEKCRKKPKMGDDDCLLLQNADGSLHYPKMSSVARTEREGSAVTGAEGLKINDSMKALQINDYKTVSWGSSENICEETGEGKRDALKICNGINKEGHEDIRHEIEMYNFMREKCPELLELMSRIYWLGCVLQQVMRFLRENLFW